MSDQQTTTKTTWTQEELVAEARARFGDDARSWAFRCPRCDDDATAQDFIDAGADPQRVGQECIGRSLGVLAGKATKDGRKPGIRGCDWTAYGLFGGPWSIVLPADGERPERTAYGFPLSPARQAAVAS